MSRFHTYSLQEPIGEQGRLWGSIDPVGGVRLAVDQLAGFV